LNDPDGDGSGNGAQSPDGDSYNELWGAFDALFELVPRAE
jgi:hypothetical protein